MHISILAGWPLDGAFGHGGRSVQKIPRADRSANALRRRRARSDGDRRRRSSPSARRRRSVRKQLSASVRSLLSYGRYTRISIY